MMARVGSTKIQGVSLVRVLMATSFLALPVHQARADKGTALGILGALAGSIAGPNGQAQQQQTSKPGPIIWNNPAGGNSQETASSEQDDVDREAKVFGIVMQMQEDLDTMGFLHQAPGGFVDLPTVQAIVAWQTSFNLPADGKVTADQVDLMHLAAREGFKTGKDYYAAKNSGFDDAATYEAFQESGFPTKEEFDVARKSGFATKAQRDAAQAAGFATMQQFQAIQLSSIKSLVDDLQSFLPGYKGDLDMAFITSRMKDLAPAAEGQWTPQVQASYEALKGYSDKLPGFPEFEAKQDAARKAKADAQKATLLADAQSALSFSDAFLRAHLTDSRAINLNDALAKLATPLASLLLEQLQDLDQKEHEAIDTNQLQAEYSQWQSQHGLEDIDPSNLDSVGVANQSPQVTATASIAAPAANSSAQVQLIARPMTDWILPFRFVFLLIPTAIAGVIGIIVASVAFIRKRISILKMREISKTVAPKE